ncbi:hypothetical protein DVH26_07775 [Paenibacillus sp. H1-7]|uniref:glycoside hydrolase family 55 protein n=1 Tax=Paenibacillus sp. H1-7 TaxID=2282849 RepID=UPI001EF96F25|nr:glycoside hydrolase family 55 protein [Paenibacillus sp. H1-7]ULL14356.1 hypothetical protein DVH26_07775 [Paenibacillus sp. H1-7]
MRQASEQIANQLSAFYPDYNKLKTLVDVGFFLENYVVEGGVVTKNIQRNDKIDVTEIVVSLDNDVTRREGTSFQTKIANVTYYLDYQSGDFKWGTSHPSGSYLPISEVTTDSFKNVSVITDKRGPVGGFRLLSDYGLTNIMRVLSVKDFGAKGDGVADDTAAIQAAVIQGIQTGSTVWFPTPAVKYRVTDTIYFRNTDYLFPTKLIGNGGMNTIIEFDNSVVMKNLFFIDTNVNYLEFRSLNFIDKNPRTSRAFYFRDTINEVPIAPSWKHSFHDFRINGFKEGIRWDGDSNPTSDTHLDGGIYQQGKFRNCETSLIFNNIQAVNHLLLNIDFENDDPLDATQKWKQIKFERGSFVNHVGGSVFGYGPYVFYEYPTSSYFQATHQFSSVGVRMEAKGLGPFIHHSENSTITLSNFFRIVITDMGIISNQPSSAIIELARFGGRSYAEFNNVRSTVTADVKGIVTANLTSNGQTGQIKINRCRLVRYVRVTNESGYGSGLPSASSLVTIPGDVSTTTDDSVFTTDSNGYDSPKISESSYLPTNWSVNNVKTLTLQPSSTSGFGAGTNPSTAKVLLPPNGRPMKFKIIRDAVNVGIALTLNLKFTVSGVDYTVASIAFASNEYGYKEASIIPPAAAMTFIINDGVAWDGKMTLEKTGSSNGLSGIIMIDYM